MSVGQDALYYRGSVGGGGGDGRAMGSQPDYSNQYQPGHGGGGIRDNQLHDSAHQQNPQRIRFTPEEIRAMKECNRESFYYRCLPLGTVMGCGAYFAVKRGYLKPSVRFGAGPKMAMASIVGYFIGKFSYQNVCAEKLMALPNSRLGEVIRRRKGQGQGMGFQDSLALESMYPTTPAGVPGLSTSEFGQSQSHVYSDVGDTRPMSGFDSEGASSLSGYDTSHSNYDTTQQMLDDENLPPKRPQYSTTYDDLRRQNRVEYETKQYSRSPAPAPPVETPHRGYQDSRSDNSHSSLGTFSENRPRNKYGDMWDDKPSNY